MRGLVTFMAIAGIGGGLFLWQKRHEQESKASETPTASRQQATTAEASLTPAPRGQASEYNWMKHSLDRAADVRDQARARTKEAQEP
jgi:hypothetical protein